MSFVVKKTNFFDRFLVYKSTKSKYCIDTITAMTSKFFKQTSEIKCMCTMVVAVVRFVFVFLRYYGPTNTHLTIMSMSVEILKLFQDRCH